jgi:hypothetical protein
MTLAQLMALVEVEMGPQKDPRYGQQAEVSEWADFG